MIVASLAVVVVAYAGGKATSPTPAPAFTADESTAYPGDDWIAWNGNIKNQRYSTLTEIDASNVSQLKVAWKTNLTIPGLKAKQGPLGVFAEQQPIVYKGVMYMPDASGNLWAIDTANGERLWVHKTKFPKGLTPLLPSRGVSMGDGKIYMGLPDASLQGIDMTTGRTVWKNYPANYKNGYYFTAAPTYYNGMVLLPASGGDSGGRAFISAHNAKTGKEIWRFWAIPVKPGDPGYGSWPKKRAYPGGGAMWNTPVVDPDTNTVYVLNGNPIPYSGLLRGKGKELYTDSVIALNASTGKLKWYWQQTHHDIWDLDPTNPIILFDLPDGRKGLAYAGKTGWLYELNRLNGKPLIPGNIYEKKVKQNAKSHTYPTQPYVRGDAFSKQCATARLYKGKKAPDGKPYKAVGCIYTPYDDTGHVAFAPAALGGANWPPSAYSPDTNYQYICSKDSESSFKAIPAEKQKLKALGDFSQVEGLTPGKGVNVKSTGRIVAMNLVTNKIAWQVKWPTLCYSGVTATAGNLVFAGQNEGTLKAYNATTGALLWTSPSLKAGVNAPPVTFSQNGKQYVGVFAGGNGIASLFGGVKPFYGSTFYAFALPS
jgi:PQQ-dependent dehydrogenase (methanol/ethanol family)